MKTVFIINSEWDIGENAHAFTSIATAKSWLLSNATLHELAEGEDAACIDSYLQDLIDNSFISFSELKVL